MTVKLTNASLLPLLAAALLAGCGGIDSADNVLSTGEVSGSLQNAAVPANAYAYVFGHPEIRAQLKDDGSFKLEKVPLGTGAAQVVIYDGGESGSGRAERVDVQVRPGGRTHLDNKDAQQMPLAGSIAAAVICTGGQRGDDALYQVEGTEFEDDSRHQGASATLYPLPPGDYTLHAKLKGMKETSPRSVTVAAGAVASGDVDMGADDSVPPTDRGCRSTACTGALLCDFSDGSCYPCTSEGGGCAAPEICHSHVCELPK
jgi:hypothetical protein